MRKTILAGCIVLIAAAMAAQTTLAQIVITRSSIEDFFNADFSVVSSMSFDEDKIVALLDTKGADQVWDFSDMEFEFTMMGDGRIQAFTSVEGTLGEEFEHFEQATHVIRGDIIISETYEGEEFELTFANYEYSILSDEEYMVLGVVISEFLDPEEREIDGLIKKRPGQVRYEFPVSYQSSWESEYEEQSIFFGFDNSFNYTEEVVVDGWGELITPHGTFEVLRVTRLRKMSLGFAEIESLEVEFVNENGLPLAMIEAEIDFVTGEYDTEYAEATLNLILTETSAQQEPAMELPARATLHQNYPNPFNPTTVISYQVPEQSQVRLAVYDLTGRRIDTLVDAVQGAGEYYVTWDASQLASGVYFYRLETGGEVLTRRMSLVK